MIDLTKLEAPLETVRLPSGNEYQPVRFNGFMADIYQQVGADNGDGDRDLRLIWQLVGTLLPEATEDEIKGLTIAQATAVIAVAAGKVELVLDAEKNGPGADLMERLGSALKTPPEPSSSPSPVSRAGTFDR